MPAVSTRAVSCSLTALDRAVFLVEKVSAQVLEPPELWLGAGQGACMAELSLVFAQLRIQDVQRMDVPVLAS